MQVIDTSISTAEKNMEIDRDLLESLDPNGEPIFHVYDWENLSATYGYFIDPEKLLNLQNVEKWGLSLAKRPTGGGILFHIWDLAFSFLMPSNHKGFSINTLDNYRFVNEVVLSVVQNYFSLPAPSLITEEDPSIPAACQNFCMAKPTQYDVVHQGIKVAGAAQRRRKQGYLHQGTISLAFPDLSLLEELLLSKEEVASAMAHFTFAPLGAGCSEAILKKTRGDLQALLIEKFIEKLRAII